MNFVTRAQLADWLDGLSHEQTLIAPRNIAGVLLYRPVDKSADISWDLNQNGQIRPVLSAKEALFPSTERLIIIEKNGQEFRLTETLPEKKQVVFGIRPCDARGILALDALFINTEPIDSYYSRRRDNTVLIGLTCQEMGPSCFCTSVGGSPDDTAGMDIVLIEADGGYWLDAITEKGAAIASQLTLGGIDHLREEASTKINLPTGSSKTGQRDPARFTIPLKSTWPAQFHDDYWDSLSERCLSCRLCAYVCPTCRCFDVRDEAILELDETPTRNAQDQFERLRCWDSCAGLAYRRIAGGHNPRAEKSQRTRNRFFCKFYYYPEQYGAMACTGCGRCIDICPVNIDITEVLTNFAEATGVAEAAGA